MQFMCHWYCVMCALPVPPCRVCTHSSALLSSETSVPVWRACGPRRGGVFEVNSYMGELQTGLELKMPGG